MIGPPLATPHGGGFPWIWVAVGGGVLLLIVIVAIVAAARNAADEANAGDLAAEDKRDLCEAACAQLDGCSLPQPAACVTSCTSTPFLQRCLELDSCDAKASCMLGLACRGSEPQGTASCSTTAICQGNCNGDPECMCGCLSNMAPANAIALARLNLCVITHCSSSPTMECAANNCGPALQACATQ